MGRVRELNNILCLLRSAQIRVYVCVCVFLSISTHLFLHYLKNVFNSYTNVDLRMASGETAGIYSPSSGYSITNRFCVNIIDKIPPTSKMITQFCLKG